MKAFFDGFAGRTAFALAILAGLSIGVGASFAKEKEPKVDFVLTVLHNNDGESKLLPSGDVGGVARFATLVEQLKAEALASEADCDCEQYASFPFLRFLCELLELLKRSSEPTRGAVMISSGDNFLAGPEFGASLDQGVPFYDSIALSLIGYDAIAIGNHEFDFGPDVLANFIVGFMPETPFLSANLIVDAEPRLAALEAEGTIAKSVILRESGEKIGVVGATTPLLPAISSPRNVVVRQDVAAAVQAEIDRLERRGVNKIILASHLQSVDEDLALLPMLRGVDVAIAGGGDELLANPDTVLIPGDEVNVAGSYPLEAVDARGRVVPVITTSGDYRYVGRLVVSFDKKGNLLSIGDRSGPVRVVGGSFPDAVAPNPIVVEQVEVPVAAAVAERAATIIATSEVPLDGSRPNIRVVETNLGNLVADALFYQATLLAPSFGVAAPDVALQNGGGIRNNNVLPAGNLSRLTTFSILPFANFVAIVPDVSRERFKQVLENCVSRVAFVDGRFAQISGFTLVYDATAPVGSRVLDVTLDDGTQIVVGGVVQPGAALSLATNDFSARGGDQWPLGDLPLTTLGATYLEALETYLADGLDGAVTAADYPVGGEGRIVELP